MKITKARLQEIIKEELKTLNELEEWEDESKYNVGDLIEVEISDDGYDKSIEKIASENEFRATHGTWTQEKFLAKIIQVSKREWEDDEPSPPDLVASPDQE